MASKVKPGVHLLKFKRKGCDINSISLHFELNGGKVQLSWLMIPKNTTVQVVSESLGTSIKDQLISSVYIIHLL